MTYERTPEGGCDRATSPGLRGVLWTLMVASAVAPTPSWARQDLRVVTSLTTYAALAREITGDLADVRSIARGDVDPHFVNARPSFAVMIQQADLFVSTGLDLELWIPGLLDRANNQRVIDGAPGNVVAYSGIQLLDVPENVSRTGGDVHVFGNPHVHTDPINAIIVARNITAGLKRVAPRQATTFDANLADFEDRILKRLFGERLVEILGKETLFDLAATRGFWQFASTQTLQGRPLTEYLGGWLAEAAPFRDKQMVCYHKNWAYFAARFRVDCAIFVEPKPGIPASPGHVRKVIDFMRDESITVILGANYFSRAQLERVAARTGAQVVLVPFHEGGEEGIDTYFELVDTWVSRLSRAFGPNGN